MISFLRSKLYIAREPHCCFLMMLETNVDQSHVHRRREGCAFQLYPESSRGTRAALCPRGYGVGGGKA